MKKILDLIHTFKVGDVIRHGVNNTLYLVLSDIIDNIPGRLQSKKVIDLRSMKVFLADFTFFNQCKLEFAYTE